jgi:hypothetical protein
MVIRVFRALFALAVVQEDRWTRSLQTKESEVGVGGAGEGKRARGEDLKKKHEWREDGVCQADEIRK